MNDADSPDRVPLDRPPVPRFNPLPDLPDLPDLPRGSAIAPTPSVPIPAPPMPAPRVMVDLPRPSPTVIIDPPKPRPAAPPKPAATPPAPPVVASTPAPQGRWVGEALASLVRPTKSKATVLGAAGCLVAGAFVLQVLVGTGGPTAPTTRTTRPEVVAKAADVPPAQPTPPEEALPVPKKSDDLVMPAIPEPVPAEQRAAGGFAPPAVLPKLDGTNWPALNELPRVAPARPPEGATISKPPGSAMTLPTMPPPPDGDILRVGGETPAVPIPVLPAVEGPMPLAAPVTVPPPVVPAIPAPATTPAAPELVKVTLPTPPAGTAPPALTRKPIEPAPTSFDFPKPPNPAVKVAPVEPAKPLAPAPQAITEVLPAPTPPLPTLPALPPPVTVAPTPAMGFKFDEPAAQPKLPTPPAPAAEARTDFDVDLHPAQAGQTYEAVSKQHYADAKYADALRAFNKGRDPAREELQIPPTYHLRKLAAGGRAPAATNPIAPAGGETWAPPATLGGAKPVAAGRSYTVTQDGTTFRDLAGTLLNDRTKYRRISDLNPTIDANAKLQKGDKVTVP